MSVFSHRARNLVAMAGLSPDSRVGATFLLLTLQLHTQNETAQTTTTHRVHSRWDEPVVLRRFRQYVSSKGSVFVRFVLNDRCRHARGAPSQANEAANDTDADFVKRVCATRPDFMSVVDGF